MTAATVSLFIVTGRMSVFPRQPEVSLINTALGSFTKHSINLLRFQNWSSLLRTGHDGPTHTRAKTVTNVRNKNKKQVSG